jgi:hypothetical protein
MKSTLKKLDWNHDGSSISEVLGYDDGEELKEEARKRIEEDDISLVVAMGLMVEIFESDMLKYIGRLIYPDQVSSPSKFAEIIYNLILEDSMSDEPIIDSDTLLVNTISGAVPAMGDIVRDVWKLLKILGEDEK